MEDPCFRGQPGSIPEENEKKPFKRNFFCIHLFVRILIIIIVALNIF